MYKRVQKKNNKKIQLLLCGAALIVVVARIYGLVAVPDDRII